MIPLRLQLRNFMCYTDNVAPLVLDGIHIACLAGDNGHGKSALLDAITWALWGKARSKNDDELIHIGKTEMEVEFEFELEDNRYRLIRKRSLKGKRSLPHLEFQIYSRDGYVPITGNTIQDTQRKISDVLRIEYETFINSAFILQGRADEFTVKPPAERKKVLAEILGLSFYDQLEERSREQSRRCETERRELASAIEQIDLELSRKPEYEVALEAVQQQLRDLEEAVKSVGQELAELREKKNQLDLKVKQREEIEFRVRQAQHDLAETERRIDEHERKIGEYQRIIAEKKMIEDGYHRFVQLKEMSDDLNAKLAQWAKLSEQKANLEKVISEKRSQLLAGQQLRTNTIAALQKKCEQTSVWQQELQVTKQKLEALAGLEAERDRNRDLRQSEESEIKALKERNVLIQQEIGELKEKRNMLKTAAAVCPVCESSLGEDGRERLISKFEMEQQRYEEGYRNNQSRVRDLVRQIEQVQKHIGVIESALREKEALQRKAVALEKNLIDAEEASKQIALEQEQLEWLRGQLARSEYALAEQEALAALQNDLAKIGYDKDQHDRVRDELGGLRKYEDLRSKLMLAEHSLVQEQGALEQTRKTEGRWRQMLASDLQAKERIEQELAALPSLSERLSETEKNLDLLLRQQADARQRLGQTQQMLNHCRYLEEQRQIKVVASARVIEEKSICDDLTLAFGKKGIQAIMIENAIPEIEAEANALLSRMTDNRMHVTFETQRDTRSGDGVIETLDIKIADELGTRSYELYSGGEAFRVNFAIRIALSKLLARRAGARLQTLVIDEGFGTQDTSGRERLVEAINSIRDDFDKILVITHVDELKDAFPVRIDVVKTAEGSQIIFG
ncbi:MAG: SMC family ATPase [Chloroflexi bacterium]|nr:SMC family ATPase [Chloroflexota bacterium]MCL5074936.1 SMC family ATPase [Chloroflexota bacterium]